MPHIVFLTNSYIPETDANVVCANNVMQYLIKKGYDVTCVCGTKGSSKQVENFNGIQVLRIPHHSFNSQRQQSRGIKKLVLSSVHTLKSVLVLPVFPNIDPLFSDRLFRELESLNKTKTINCIIGVFRPYATIYAMNRYKQRHPSIVAIGYYLDVLKGAKKPFGISKVAYDSLCDRKEQTVFEKFDMAIIAENGRHFFEENSIFIQYRNKIRYVNFPTMIARNDSKPVQKNCLKLVYAGYMDRKYRNPTNFIKLLILLKENIPNLQFHIFGFSDMDNDIYAFQSAYSDLIFYHGRVEKTVVDNEYANADCLISIGNDISGIVPSKIFELFGNKKPIIHITPGENDATIEYFKLYPDCVIVSNLADENNAKKIYNFLKGSHDKISTEYLNNVYHNATPQAVVEIIEEYL